MNSAIYIEIGNTSLRAAQGDSGLELTLERSATGALTENCRGKIVGELQGLIRSQSGRPKAYCAIVARGVSLRRFSVPAVPGDEFDRLLRMQIESEFPLPPDQLAWGSRSLGETRQNGSSKRELLVFAVKREILDEYASLLKEAGLEPVFTLSAFARASLSPRPADSFGILEVGEQNSELALFENGVPVQVRIVPFSEKSSAANAEGLHAFAKGLNGSWSGKKLLVIGSDESFKAVNSCLNEQFTSGIECEPLRMNPRTGSSSAVLGLRKAVESGTPQLLFFESQQMEMRSAAKPATPMKRLVLAAVLVLALIALPYLEALIAKPLIEKKLARLKADEGRLDVISKELGFLQHLKDNQPPYLDALYLFAKSAPQGSKIETLTMNRRGEVSLRGSLRNADQVADFRNKLIASGFFSSVSVEEQAPTPDKQKLNVRLTAQWKSFHERQKLAIGPTPEEIEKAKSKPASPPGMPAGMSMPMPVSMPVSMPSSIPPGALPPGITVDMLPSGAMPAGLPPNVRVSAPRREAN